jgi:hypothetical protein
VVVVFEIVFVVIAVTVVLLLKVVEVEVEVLGETAVKEDVEVVSK